MLFGVRTLSPAPRDSNTVDPVFRLVGVCSDLLYGELADKGIGDRRYQASKAGWSQLTLRGPDRRQQIGVWKKVRVGEGDLSKVHHVYRRGGIPRGCA